MKKMLFVFPSFYPAYKSGGPVRSATNLIKLLKNKYKFNVFTAARELGEELPFSGVNVDSWDNNYEEANVFYSVNSNHSFLKLVNIFHTKQYDIIYLNSFFNYRFSTKFVIFYKLGLVKCNSLVLALRGELTNGAMSIKSKKKKAYLTIFKLLGLKKNIKFHFTSEDEKNESLYFLGKSEYIFAPNMHGEVPSYNIKQKEKNKLNALFLSRISPKKNLLLAIEAFSKIHFGEVHFTIAGEIDDKVYWEKCCKQIQRLPNNIKVSFIGAINRERVSEELFKSHLFILPTLNENYGHAIVEAMMHSNLVLISDQTPWSGVQNHGGSVVYNQSLDGYIQEINKVILLEHSDFNRQSNAVYKYCDEILKNNVASINQMFE